MATLRYKFTLLGFFITNLAMAGTGSAKDEGLFYLGIIGFLGTIVLILYLFELLSKSLRKIIDQLIDGNDSSNSFTFVETKSLV